MITNENNAFTTAGNVERAKLTDLYAQIGITKFTFTNSTGYDSVEGYFETPGGTRYVVEAKCRQGRVNQYPTHMIERKKYDVLAGYLQRGYTPLYINFFNDGNVIIYNLKKRIEEASVSWSLDKCKSTTAVHGKYIDKWVGYLSVDEAIGDRKVSDI